MIREPKIWFDLGRGWKKRWSEFWVRLCETHINLCRSLVGIHNDHLERDSVCACMCVRMCLFLCVHVSNPSFSPLFFFFVSFHGGPVLWRAIKMKDCRLASSESTWSYYSRKGVMRDPQEPWGHQHRPLPHVYVFLWGAHLVKGRMEEDFSSS